MNWCVLVVIPLLVIFVETSAIGSDLIRLSPLTTTTDNSGKVTVRGLLEARQLRTDPWRKVCSPRTPKYTRSSAVPVAACRDLGFRSVSVLQVGGTQGLGDLYIKYTDCKPNSAAIESLVQCGTRNHEDGITSECSRQRLWIWITCTDQVSVGPGNPSALNCNGDAPLRKMATGEDLTITIKDRISCKIPIEAVDKDVAMVLVKPVAGKWVAEAIATDCKKLIHRLIVKTIGAVNDDVDDGYMCSEKARKVSEKGSSIVISYTPPDPSVTTEDITLQVSVRRMLTCNVDHMSVLMPKTEIDFQGFGSGDEGADPVGRDSRVYAFVGPSAREGCMLPVDTESDVLQIDLPLYPIAACGMTVESDNYRAAITFTHILSSTNEHGAIERLDRRKISFKCKRQQDGFSIASHELELKVF